METQVTNLKLNVTNIKSYLINSNKELKRLKTQKKELFFKLQKKQEVSEEEKRVETKNLGIGAGFSKITSAVTSPVRSIFDKILDFFGLIALGLLVRELPKILEAIDGFFNSGFIKGVKAVIDVIGSGFQKLGELINVITPGKQKEIDGNLKQLSSDLDEDLKGIDSAEKDITALEPELLKREKEKEPKDVNPPGMPPLGLPPGSMYPLQLNPPRGNEEKKIEPQKLAGGGTTKEPYAPKTPRQTGEQKRAKTNMTNGFTDFSVSVENIGDIAKLSEENMLALADFNKLFRDWSSFEDDGSGTDPTNPRSRNPRQRNRPPAPYSTTPSVGALSSLLPYGRPTYTPGEGFRQNRPGHNGVDIGVDPNSPVIATQNGVVQSVSGLFGTWGEGLYVKYNDGTTGVYGHIVVDDKYRVAGTQVKRGDKIGKVKDWPRGVGGNTSYDQNSHLHYERINKNGSYIDPQPYINSLSNTSATSAGATKKHQGPVLKASNNGMGGRVLNTNSQGGNETIIVMVQPVETFVPMPIPQIIRQPSRSTTQRRKLPTEWSV